MNMALLIAIAAALIYVCYTDIRWRTIKNDSVIFIVLLSLSLGFSLTGGVALLFPLSILAVGFILSLLNIIGAGDIKLLFSLSLGLNNNQIGDLLIYTAMAGLPVTLVTLVIYKLFLRHRKIDVPYGVAITLGYAILLSSGG